MAPEQGLPPTTDGSPGLAPTNTALLHLHDRSDTSVPADGKLSSDGWRCADPRGEPQSPWHSEKIEGMDQQACDARSSNP